MVLLRLTALFATLAVGVLALQGKSKTDTSDEMWKTFVQETDALAKKGLSYLPFPDDESKETFDHFLSEFLLIKGFQAYVFEHDFKTILTREGNWKACNKAVEDAQELVKNTTVYSYLVITMGLLKGWDETTGRLAGACQTFSILKSTYEEGHYIGAVAGTDHTASMIENLTKAGHKISIDNSPEAKSALNGLKKSRAKEMIENEKAAAAFYAKQGNETESGAGQESKMSDPGASKGDKKEKTDKKDKKEKTDKGSGSKHNRRRLPLH